MAVVANNNDCRTRNQSVDSEPYHQNVIIYGDADKLHGSAEIPLKPQPNSIVVEDRCPTTDATKKKTQKSTANTALSKDTNRYIWLPT